MEHKEIMNIGVEHIHPHPDNPRKDLGDLAELVESIRKNGVMQNLTVIPLEDQSGEYTVIIGHRRHAAATKADIKELPCRIIEGMSKKEQVSTMLEENMQRSDLTIYEQAQGFQMMLDLGETEDSIAEKTGFSKTTVRRRLNIAKLDQKELMKKEQDDGFQLSLKDLYALEQVEDIKTRNKILKEANSSRDLIWKAQSAAAEAVRNKNAKAVIAILTKMGLKPAPKNAENEIWSGKWDTVKQIELDKDVPEKISLKGKDKDTLYYLQHYREIRVIKKADKKEKKLSDWEIRQRDISKNKKTINAKAKEMAAVRKDFIQNIISGKIDALKNTLEAEQLLWKALALEGTYINMRGLAEFFLDKEYYGASEEEREAAKKKVNELSVYKQMLVLMPAACQHQELVDYNGFYKKDSGEALKALYEVLMLYGFSYESDEEEQLVNGTHELYIKQEGKG